jgi:hypothetical protein
MQPQHHHMNPEDTALCQQAIELANAGQKQRAYEQFCALQYRNADHVTLLYWIAFTTPYREEARRVISDIARIEPNHPKLPELYHYVSRMQPSIAELSSNIGPVLHCPYCHHVGQVRIAQKISTAGWILFVVILIAFFPLCWIGFLIKKDYYVCNFCGIALGDRP